MSGCKSSAPLLTALSTYESSPKWTIPTNAVVINPKGTSDRESTTGSGPAAYNPNSCVDKTSKFKKIAFSCAFSSSKRFASEKTALAIAHAPPGPGTYNPPSDFSSAPHPKLANVTFSKTVSPTPKRGKTHQGSVVYDIRGLHRLGGTTFDQKGVTVNHRHGWYYDGDIKSRRSNPGPGAYNPNFPHDKTDRKFSFGTGDRPELSIPSCVGNPAPGQYLIPSTLSSESHSFSRASPHSIPSRDKTSTVGPLCGQPTQFG